MRKLRTALPLTAIVLLSFLYDVFPQNREEWSAAKGQLTWREGDVRSDEVIVNGANMRILHNGLVTIVFHIVDAGNYYVATILVANESAARLIVDPDNFRIAFWKKAEKNKPLGQGDWMYSIPATKVASKYRNRAEWSAFFRSLGAGMATTTTTTREAGSVLVTGGNRSASGTYSGTTTSTTPDYAAIAAASAQNARTLAAANDHAGWIMDSAFKANTLFPKDRHSGMVYFERKKFASAYVILRIDNIDYLFGIGPTKK